MSLLEQGELVLLFPEGTRGDGQHFQGVNRGVAMLAKRTGVPVVPVGITGTQFVMPRDREQKARHHRMVVACGESFTYAETAKGSNEKENRELFANELARRIMALCDANGLPLRSEPDTKGPTVHGSLER
jgi:1-acyl-sn-glycerol-3-phosphate acyltransferase